MPRMTIGSGNPSAQSFTMILDGLTTATVSLVGPTKAIYTLAGIDYVITGTSLTVAGGELTGGTITGISSSIGGLGLHALTKLNLAVADVLAAVDDEIGGNATALDDLLLGRDWIISGTGGDNTSLANQLSGDNIWYGGAGNDSFEGGIGEDNLFGGIGNDFLGGNASDDAVSGDAGNDTAYGDSGNDILNGDAGADILYGGNGRDTMYGGAISGTSADTAANTLYGGDGADLVSDGAGNGVLQGEDGADKVNGFGGSDLLYGGADNDILKGGAGNDTTYGSGGNDTIIDGAGADVLLGGTDNDLLLGGAGADTATGGVGVDTFQFRVGDFDTLGGGDSITDFLSGTDRISFRTLGLTFIESSAFTAANATPEVRWNEASDRLEVDLNGDNTADGFVRLQDGASVVASDLIL